MNEYQVHSPRVFGLLAAAGCTPQSTGGGMHDWGLSFLDPDGKPVRLAGACRDWRDGTRLARNAAVEWLTAHGLKPSPEAVERVRLADAVGNAADATERNAAALDALTLSIASLRASRVDDGSIRVWPFHAAPPELQALSGHGGDEDWLALVPAGMDEPSWSEGGVLGFASRPRRRGLRPHRGARMNRTITLDAGTLTRAAAQHDEPNLPFVYLIVGQTHIGTCVIGDPLARAPEAS